MEAAAWRVPPTVGSSGVRSLATGGRIRWHLGSREEDLALARVMGGGSDAGSGGDGDLARESGERGR
jgi:hypothetical protein